MIKGMILLWAGEIVDIPFGWHLCDGTMDTPDLRDKFVRGAGDTFNPGDEGGALTHVHTFTTDGHSHFFAAGSGLSTGFAFVNETTTVQDTGTTNAGSSLPPYHALAYIMKL